MKEKIPLALRMLSLESFTFSLVSFLGLSIKISKARKYYKITDCFVIMLQVLLLKWGTWFIEKDYFEIFNDSVCSVQNKTIFAIRIFEKKPHLKHTGHEKNISTFRKKKKK